MTAIAHTQKNLKNHPIKQLQAQKKQHQSNWINRLKRCLWLCKLRNALRIYQFQCTTNRVQKKEVKEIKNKKKRIYENQQLNLASCKRFMAKSVKKQQNATAKSSCKKVKRNIQTIYPLTLSLYLWCKTASARWRKVDSTREIFPFNAILTPSRTRIPFFHFLSLCVCI